MDLSDLSESSDAIARRTDVALRAHYPHLHTRIFEIAPNCHVLTFEKDQADAGKLAAYFDKSIRPLASQIYLSNTVPQTFRKELSPIADFAISHGFEGIHMSVNAIQNILLAKYPDLPPFRGGRRNDGSLAINLTFEKDLNAVQEGNVRQFMHGILPGWPIIISVGPPEIISERVKAIIGDSLDIRPSNLRSKPARFIREDESFWFSNIDALFENNLQPNSFSATANADAACYIDASAFPQLDLRQAVLLYDTIYFTPPIVNANLPGPSFWELQAVSREDLLSLVENGRLRLVLSQPEERTDLGFVEAAYERNPAAVIGRRTAAAILISDIVQTAEEYTFANPSLKTEVGRLARDIAAETKSNDELIARFLLWPVYARRACLVPLLNGGLMGISSFSQGRILADQIKEVTGKDYLIEADFTSYGVHVAHALNATLLPPITEMKGWIEPRQMVGDRLNFYRSFNSRIAASWVGNERRKENRIRVLPPLPLFSFNKHAPFRDLVRASAKFGTRRNGRSLVTRLSTLSYEERVREIDRLGKDLYELGSRREKLQIGVDSISDGIDVGAAILGASLLPVRPMWNFFQRALEIARRNRTIDRLVDVIEHDIGDQFGLNAEIDFLSKVNRVATLTE